MKEIKSNPAKTALIISMGFLVVFMVYKLHWALLVSLAIGLIGALFEGLSKMIEKIWFKLAYVLSLIVPNILLGFIFFLFLYPISLLSKLFRKNDLLKLKNSNTSVYTIRTDVFDKAHFDNMW